MATKQQVIERTEQMLRVMQKLPAHERRKHFDMGWWGSKTECGTVCCVAGFCGMDPWFRRRGVKLEFKPGNDLGHMTVRGREFDTTQGALESFFGVGAWYDIFTGDYANVGEAIRGIKTRLKDIKDGKYDEYMD